MLYSTSMMLAAMAIGEVVAGPTHAHLHRKMHEKKDVDWAALDWDAMGINWSSAYEAGLASKTSAAAAPAATAETVATSAAAAVVATPATTSAASTATSSVSDVVSTVESDLEELFAGLVGVSNALTSFGKSCECSSTTTGDFATGETGHPYGSNVIKVDSISGYDYTNTFTNTQSKAITVNIWNKAGADGEPLSGSALAPTETTLTFVLAAGASQVVAFMENSEVAWAQAVSEKAASGAYATTWGEANFVSTGSGYDMSAIMNSAGNNYNMAISSTEAPACTSDMTQNYWLTATDPVGTSDGSCYIAQSTAHLTTIMGGTV